MIGVLVLTSVFHAYTPVFAKPNLSRTGSVTVHQKPKLSPFRGWDFLVEKLRSHQIPEHEIRSVYTSPRMPIFDKVPFSLRPREPMALYAGFAKPQMLASAREFMEKHRDSFSAASSHYQVDESIIGAIILIETHCGRNTGKEMVLNRLSRVASVGEPKNLVFNHKRLQKEDPSITFEQVRQRAEYLESTFLPEIPALFEIARRNRVNIFNIRGSIAGAYGIPQFLPSTYIRFAVDGNNDGIISLFSEADSIWSVANYLKAFGWRNDASDEDKAKVVWFYNHSDAYVHTALDVAKKLKEAAVRN